MATDRTAFAAIIDRIQDVPSLPEVVVRLCALLDDPEVDARAVSELVSKDAAMAAKMLRMVNSVFYGLPQPVRGLEQALAILGFKTVRAIALSISVISAFQQANACFSMRAFWRHAAVAAGICKLTATRCGLPDPELAFLLGLFKDLGRLVLVGNLPDECRAVIALARERQQPFRVAAQELLGSDEAELGAWLCRRWQLDAQLADAIADRYHPERAADPRLVAAMAFTDHLCARKHLRAPGDFDDADLDATVWSLLDLDRAGLIGLLLAVDTEAGKAQQLLLAAGP